MALASGAWISRHQWTPLPMPREAIDRISHIGQNQGMPATIMYTDWHSNEGQDGLDEIQDDDSSASSQEYQPDVTSIQSDDTLEYDSSDALSSSSDSGSDDDDGDNDDLSIPHQQADPVIIGEQPDEAPNGDKPILHPIVPQPMISHNPSWSTMMMMNLSQVIQTLKTQE